MKKIVVILANSIKHGKHCVAGKCVSTKQWIRPVGNRGGAELSDDQITYENMYGKFKVKPLQKIEMNFSAPVPLPHQPDNYLIDDTQWQQKYSISLGELHLYADQPANLWGPGASVPYIGVEMGIMIINQSLYLVKVTCLMLKRIDSKRRAIFIYGSCNYDLPVTDPKFDTLFGEQELGGMKSDRFLCISLGENFEGNCYKIVATIF